MPHSLGSGEPDRCRVISQNIAPEELSASKKVRPGESACLLGIPFDLSSSWFSSDLAAIVHQAAVWEK